MLKSLQRFLFFLLVFCGMLYLAYQLFLYQRSLTLFPPQTMIADVNVSRLTESDAADLLVEKYQVPVVVYHRQEQLEINPQDVGFQLDVETMVAEAAAQATQDDYWMGYVQFLIGRSLEPINIELRATHDRTLLTERLQFIAGILDEPARAPQLASGSPTFREGQAGFVTNIEASLPDVEAALYQLNGREVHLIVEEQPAPELDMDFLAGVINRQIEGFDGLGSIFIMDLQTGEELSINGDVAVSGLSMMKIAILLETYRAIDFAPTLDQAKLISETIVLSGNYSANLLLDVVARQDNAYLGVDILTESLHRLGLVNTFIVTPYEEPNRPGIATKYTDANTRTDIFTNPDPTMQTTAEEMGTLLSMIYYCAQGGGALLAVYPDQITPDECQAMLDVLVLNVEGNLIRFGVPDQIPVAHKHGWGGNTHGDAGIVFSPAGDYVIVEYLADPTSDWLVHDISFPILREISRVAYNYFNFDAPYLGDALSEAERFEAEADTR